MSDPSVVTIDLNPREQRLYERLREQVVERRPGESSSFRDLLLLLPDLTVLLARLIRDDRVPLGAKAIAVAGVAYVFSPLDFMPAILLGPIGLLDDLVVVSMALSRLLNQVHPDIVRSHWSGQGDALEAIQRVTTWADTQVTTRLRGLVFGERR